MFCKGSAHCLFAIDQGMVRQNKILFQCGTIGRRLSNPNVFQKQKILNFFFFFFFCKRTKLYLYNSRFNDATVENFKAV